MKLRHTLLIFILFPFMGISQQPAQFEKSSFKGQLKISLNGGLYMPDFEKKNMQRGVNMALELGHHLTDRWIVSAHVNYGWSHYYEDVLSNIPDGGNKYRNGTNATIATIHAGAMAGYSLPVSHNFRINGHAGISTWTEMMEFPFEYVEYDFDTGEVKNIYRSPRDFAVTDLAFPVKLELEFFIKNAFSLSLTGGFYIHPDYPIVGVHAGPQLNWRF